MDHWLMYGVLTGLFWGVIALFLYVPFEKLHWVDEPWWKRARLIAAAINQFALNAIAAFAGWYCLHLFYSVCANSNAIGWTEFFLLLVFILGVTGRLSAILWYIPEAIMKYIQSKVKEKE